MDRIISINLFGQSYRFKANAETAEIEKIAEYVVREVEKAKASGDLPSKLDAVILAALNIASEYFESQRYRERLVKEVDRRAKALVDYIDSNT